MVRWKREYRRRTVQFSGMQECVKAQCSATTVPVAALFLSCLFVFKLPNALDGFGPDMDFIDSFACLWFSRFFSIYIPFPKVCSSSFTFRHFKGAIL